MKISNDSKLRFFSFNELKKINKSEGETTHNINLSILGDCSTQLLVTALSGYGKFNKINLDIYEADYNQIDQEILNGSSDFHNTNSELTIILKSTEKLKDKFSKISVAERAGYTKTYIEDLSSLIDNIPSTTNIIINSFPSIPHNVFGSFSSKVESSFDFQLSSINVELKKLVQGRPNLWMLDVEKLQSIYGYADRLDQKFFIKGDMAFGLEFLPKLAKHYIDIIKAIKGISLGKCLILDLDNTLWGGVIGDDGLEGLQLGNLGIGKAFTNLQSWAKNLKDRGIILCICSKNTESIAKEPFEKHPDMVLRLEDISVFVANWENKADNLRHIQQVLNIGFDSMVFLDDNPFERNLVRSELPQVIVPELPKDPVDYLDYVHSLNLFETASFSTTDTQRTKKYQEEAKRVSTKRAFKSIEDYLKSLEMNGTVENFDSYSIPRISQLTQRSNQFNLRTKRYSETEVKYFMESDKHETFMVKLSDKFGEYGIISLVIAERMNDTLFLDTWIMSCRVLKRGVEKFVLNKIVENAKSLNVKTITGEYLETTKNGIVANHYKDLGFIGLDNKWVLSLEDFNELSTTIK